MSKLCHTTRYCDTKTPIQGTAPAPRSWQFANGSCELLFPHWKAPRDSKRSVTSLPLSSCPCEAVQKHGGSLCMQQQGREKGGKEEASALESQARLLLLLRLQQPRDSLNTTTGLVLPSLGPPAKETLSAPVQPSA